MVCTLHLIERNDDFKYAIKTTHCYKEHPLYCSVQYIKTALAFHTSTIKQGIYKEYVNPVKRELSFIHSLIIDGSHFPT